MNSGHPALHYNKDKYEGLQLWKDTGSDLLNWIR